MFDEERYINEIKALQDAASLHAKYSVSQYEKVLENLKKIENEKNSLETKVDERTKSLKIAVNEAKHINHELRDITTKLHQNIAFFESFKNATDEANLVTKSDLLGNITYVNDNFCEVTGYSREEVLGKPHNIIRHEDSSADVFRDMWETIKAKKIWKGTIKNRKKDGGEYWVDTTISPILDDNGDIHEFIAIRHEITELVKQREELEKILESDFLTGFANRYKLLSDIISSDFPALVLINIDSFSEINDFYGDAFGDLVIIELATRLNSYISSIDGSKLYRVHGDEFAIVFHNSLKSEVVKYVNSILEEISSRDFLIQEEEISIRVTASVSFEKEKKSLFSTADMMMKIARKEQKHLLIYEESLRQDKIYENNILWAKKLKSAISDGRLVPFYQPIINNDTGEFEKYECLVRLIDEDGKVISPFFFLDIAKKTKYYMELTKIVITKSFETFKDIDAEFSINLTIKDILDPDMQNFIYSMIEKYDIGEKLVFEIVESEGIENFEKVIEFIQSIKMYGCKIAIDDFGTGYSNFEYLLQLKADYIKIDGSMVKDLDTNKDARAVVETIIDFAKKMKIKTVAEYVRSEEIYDIIKSMGVNYSQGFYFGAPEATPKIL